MRTLRALLPILAAIPAFAQSITNSSPLPNGALNQIYTVQLSCSSCTGYTYTLVSGSLPPSLNLSPGGTISGITSALGTYTFQIGLLPSGGSVAFGTKTFSISVPSGLTILTNSFPNGSVGVIYSQSLSASGGVAPYTWSISQGSLPPGLGLQNNNSIAGTPSTAGTYSFTVNVLDSQGSGAFFATSIVIGTTSSGPAITTTTLPSGVVNVAYTAPLSCSNCTGYTWSLSSGLLPLGLTLNSTGSISGTPTTAGTSSFQVALLPTQGQTGSVSQILTLTINNSGLSISQTTIPLGFAGTAYAYTLTPTGGLPPYTWTTLSQSSSNDGLTIGGTTGTITGTPTASGTFLLTFQVADSSGLTFSRQFPLTVSTALSILTTSLPNGAVGSAYPTQTLSAGGGQPPYRWALTVGPLPPGLTLDPVFGRISGTPTSNGTYPFTLTVTDNQSNTATAKLTITIGSPVTLTITPATLPAATVGTAYSQTLTASGGTAPYTWSTTTGTIPPGLTLNPSTGIISGTPTTAGTSSFTVQATDASLNTGTQALSLTVSTAAPLSITTTSLSNGTTGTAYSQTLAATGGTPPYTWALSNGTLPAGLSLNATTGAITGTPTAASTTSFTVQVTDAAKTLATKTLGIVVAQGTAPLSITAAAIATGTVGIAYSASPLTVTGGTTPYKYSLTSTSNDGLTINATTGAISGTPTASGTFTLVAQVTDSSTPAQTATQNLSLTVTAAPTNITIAPSTLPAVTSGSAYSQTLTASGGTAPYQFAVTTGSLPSGLTLSSAGAITGTTTATANATFTVTATDATGATGTRQYSLAVNSASTPTVTLAGTPVTSGFQQQLGVTPTISAAYSSAITGTVTLVFTPSVTPPAGLVGTIDDNMIQFSGGGRTATFTIPAGSTTASNLTVLTGTTAGTITLTTTISANGNTLGSPTTQTILDAAGVPFISKVVLQQIAGGVTVVITGFSSTRDMTNASFAFAPATGDTFTSDNISVPVQTVFATWYANTATSNPYGTQFTLTIPFTLATATQSVNSVAVVSVTVTLLNSKGASNPVTLSQ